MLMLFCRLLFLFYFFYQQTITMETGLPAEGKAAVVDVHHQHVPDGRSTDIKRQEGR